MGDSDEQRVIELHEPSYAGQGRRHLDRSPLCVADVAVALRINLPGLRGLPPETKFDPLELGLRHADTARRLLISEPSHRSDGTRLATLLRWHRDRDQGVMAIVPRPGR